MPQWSVAVHVRVIVYCDPPPDTVVSLNASIGAGSHPSVAVGVANDGDTVHSIVVAAGNAEITGAVVSRMVIDWLVALVLPQ